jgi:hypothetical protein
MEQFLSIINRGVMIYTAIDNKLFSYNSPNLSADLIVSLITMERAHEESLTKSRRITRAIEEAINKFERDGIYTNKVGVCPAFIDHATGKLNEYAPAFRYIVEALLNGVSEWHILQHLTANYPPPRKTWTAATIHKIKKKVPEYLIGNKVFNLNGVDRRLKGLYEPLITMQEYGKLKLLSTARIRKAPKRAIPDTFLLSGLAKCPICGGSVTSFRKSEKISSMVCTAAMKGEKHPKQVYNLYTVEALVTFIAADYINQRKQQEDNTQQGDQIHTLEQQVFKYTEAIKGLEEELEEDYSPALARALKTYESKLNDASEALQQALTGGIDTNTLQNDDWIKDVLKDTTNKHRNELKIILNQLIASIEINRTTFTKSKIESLQNIAKMKGSNRLYWQGLKGDYHAISVKVFFKEGGERWLQVSPVVMWKDKTSISFTGDDTTPNKRISLKGIRQIKQGLTDLGLVQGLIVSRGRFKDLQVF